MDSLLAYTIAIFMCGFGAGVLVMRIILLVTGVI